MSTDPVRRVAKAGARSHLSTVRPDRGLLVDLLDLTHVENEGLLRLTSEDQKFSVVELDATARLSTYKLRIVDLKLNPALAGNHLTILAAILVSFK